MPGKLILSLVFELMWGVRDHSSAAEYGDAILGGRQAIPAMLDRFAALGVHATWATVGLLFARNRDEMIDFAPQQIPDYSDPGLNPYAALHTTVGRDETDDPYHFGRSLLDRVADVEGQEIATHTFGHVYAQETGMTLDAWRADLQSAIAIAGNAGHSLSSIVFPRNQYDKETVQACHDAGLTVFRGNPPGQAYRPRSAKELSPAIRLVRFLDGALPVYGPLGFDQPSQMNGAIDIPASRFLRPWMPRLPVYSRFHRIRVIREMEHAARTGRHYHLWWHPHNMGRNTERNLGQLDAILAAFVRLRDHYGFESVTMAEAARGSG